MHLNYGKLRNHRDNMKESLADILEILQTLEGKDLATDESYIVRVSVDAFRLSVVRLREELFSAVSSLLKASNIRVSDFSPSRSFILECAKLGYIRELPGGFIKDLNRYRNEAAHRYKVPKFLTIKNFYLENEKYFKQIVEDLTQIIDKKNNSADSSKNMDLF